MSKYTKEQLDSMSDNEIIEIIRQENLLFEYDSYSDFLMKSICTNELDITHLGGGHGYVSSGNTDQQCDFSNSQPLRALAIMHILTGQNK